MALLGRVRAGVKRVIGRALARPVPARLSKNFRSLSPEGREILLASIKANYLKGWRSERFFAPAQYDYELADHLHTGLEGDRESVVPWLDSVRRLDGLRVLDIGCGTGSSTVVMAEQGAVVTAIDIDEGSLQVARDRCSVYGVQARVLQLNADAIAGFGADAFDLVIFSGSLEHMTGEERLLALRGAWEILPRGGLLAVVDAPNRLWYFDGHTSRLPFFHWLSNDLAFQYSRFSARDNFRELYTRYDETTGEHFLRRGRGVSFHEFDVAVKPASELNVLSTMHAHGATLRRLFGSRARNKYRAMLRALCPSIPAAFFEPTLDLVIRRD